MLDLNCGLAAFINDFEWPVHLVALNFGLIKFTTDESFGVENCVFWVGVEGIFSRISDANERERGREVLGFWMGARR